MEKEIEEFSWDSVKEHFEIAKSCLYCSDRKAIWHQEKEKGICHLLQAYYQAINLEPKDELLFARLLMSMYYNYEVGTEEGRVYRYVIPAYKHFLAAMESDGEKPSKKELYRAKIKYLEHEYISKQCSDNEALIKNIVNFDKLQNFYFHDSEPIYFEHDDNNAVLKLRYFDDVHWQVVTFRFSDVDEVVMRVSPQLSWIDRCYCYKLYNNPAYCFDIGNYKITCGKITITDYKISNDENSEDICYEFRADEE